MYDDMTATLLAEETGISSMNFDYLELDLHFLSRPSLIMLTETITVADQILSSSGLYKRFPPIEDPGDAAYFQDISRHHDEIWRHAMNRFLAVILDGGIEHLLTVAKH